MNPEVLKISIDQDERIVKSLNRMLALKKEKKQDVEGILPSGQVLSTKECDNLEEALVANNKVIFQEIENDRNAMLNNSNMDLAIEIFKNRGRKSNPAQIIDPNYEAETAIKEAEFKTKLKELETLDYSQAINVYNWLVDAIEYINNPNLYLTLENNQEVNTDENFFNYIIKKLEENNYSKEINSVNTMDDYFRKLISYQLEELEKYHFFAYEYMVDNQLAKKDKKENLSSVEQSIISNQQELYKEQLAKLLEEEQTLQRSLYIYEMYKKGEFNQQMQKSISFADRKQKLQEKIELARKSEIENDVSNLEEDKKRIERLNLFVVDEKMKNNSAMPFYNKAIETNNLEDITKALEAVEQLDDHHMYKQPLKDVLNAMNERRQSQEIISLEEEYRKIEEEEKNAIERATPLEAKKQNQIEEIRKKIEKVQEEIAKSQTVISDNNLTKATINEEQDISNDAIIKEDSQEENFDQLLEKLAAGEPIMKEHEEGFDITPVDEKTHFVQGIKEIVSKFSKKFSNGQSSKELEKDLLNEIASEEPIMREHEEDFDITTVDEKTHFIQKVKETISKFSEKSVKIETSSEMKKDNYYNLLKEIAAEGPIMREHEEGFDITPADEKTNLVQKAKEAVSKFSEKLAKNETSSEFNGDNYYNLLKEIAAEGPIMKEHEEDFNIAPENNKPHIIKSIKKASSNLKNKIRESEFVKKIMNVIDCIAANKCRIAVITGIMLLGTVGIGTALSQKDKSTEVSETVMEVEEKDSSTDVKIAQNTNPNIGNVESNVDTVETTENNQLNDALQDTIDQILSGKNVYSTAKDAADDTNSLRTNESQRENSWANATAAKFYDNNSEVITREEAEKIIAEGGEVVASFDNDGTIIGYARAGESLSSDASGKSM